MIVIDYKSDLPIYEQIVEQFKINIVKKVYLPGDAVPSVRKMAASLNITPSTVSKAYAELERQGVIETIKAKGTYIAESAPSEYCLNLDKCKNRLRSEMIELKHAGYTLEQIQEIIAELYGLI